jgi:5-formyltetrahydrofolate cyclo-ligase
MESEKDKTRAEFREKRDNLTPEERRAESEAIAGIFLSLPEYRLAKTIMFYASIGSEVETHDLIEKSLADGKKIVLPAADNKTKKLALSEIKNFREDTAPGCWGIPEPRPDRMRSVDAALIDLVVVPGLAFDRQGYRFGYGGGFYDRFLGMTRSTSIGLSFSQQISDKPLPREKIDLPVNIIVTENGCIRP